MSILLFETFTEIGRAAKSGQISNFSYIVDAFIEKFHGFFKAVRSQQLNGRFT